MLYHTGPYQPPVKHPGHKPDAFMINVSYYEYDSEGHLHSHLVAPKIVHYEHQNSAEFTHPDFMIYSNHRTPWYITADFGSSQEGINLVHLWDNVHIHQPPQVNNMETDIVTTAATILPNESVAKSDQKVTIIRPDSVVKAIGMQADFKTGVVHLLSHSEGFYIPAPATEDAKETH